MPFSWVPTWLMAFHVMSLVTDSFEELIMIKDPVGEDTQKLICVAEDDGSALVMNINLQHLPDAKSNEQEYTMDFNLLTSTCYNLSVKTINAYGPNAVTKTSFQVPSSVGFSNGEAPIISYHENFIKLLVPAVVNATEDGRILIVVKGSPPCNMYAKPPMYLRKFLNMTAAELGWIAKNLSLKEINSPQNLTIGHDPDDITPKGCPLDIASATYEVVVVLKVSRVDMIAINAALPKNAGNKEGSDTTTIWVTILFILITCLFLLFIRRLRSRNISTRKKLLASVNLVNNIPLSPISPSGVGPFDCSTNLLKLKTFEDYVKRAAENGILESQFNMLPRGLVRPCERGSLAVNEPKNRYETAIAYDDTRVILEQDLSNPHSDYINANYIEGYNKEKAYIATQNPKENTVIDFWRMIWQEEVRVICMLVNIIEIRQKTCEQYWPEVGKEINHGHVIISNIEERVYAHYIQRTLQLTSTQKTGSRKVKQLQYTDWPEDGVPMYAHSIVEFLNELRAMASGPGPIVVHCTAGVGRTGTIILCDICLRHTAAEGTVDVFAEARQMYNARANMLDNLQQYVLAHLMPTQCLLFMSTKIPCSDVSPEKIQRLKKDLPIHIRRLEATSWKEKALRQLEPLRPPLAEHIVKNRFPKYTPGGHSLVTLKRYPTNDANSDYISAVSVDGVKVKQQYLASQLPLPSTLSDFWRLVAERKIELIVVLQRPTPEDPSCSEIIPGEETLAPVPYISVKTKSSSDSNKYYTTDELLLIDTSEPEARWQDITVLTCNNWGLAEDAEPPSPEALVALWRASERIPRAKGYTLVLCHDGVTGCGLYLALSLLLERMAVERECDVILAVRAVRRSRPEFVNSKAQFEYLYDAALTLVDCFRTYANFT